jgi:hypothetical protein
MGLKDILQLDERAARDRQLAHNNGQLELNIVLPGGWLIISVR